MWFVGFNRVIGFAKLRGFDRLWGVTFSGG